MASVIRNRYVQRLGRDSESRGGEVQVRRRRPVAPGSPIAAWRCSRAMAAVRSHGGRSGCSSCLFAFRSWVLVGLGWLPRRAFAVRLWFERGSRRPPAPLASVKGSKRVCEKMFYVSSEWIGHPVRVPMSARVEIFSVLVVRVLTTVGRTIKGLVGGSHE